ncbi:hypothetical protein ASPWEDRAFT_53968 [Aspergillus wentii DTO 134E9]|uniref:Pentatricopeptide repeat-containing protein-mitochondrial domain-containing protein n=1 Tax=Aspergillus wentii DTO 134E9 TaxID=1073089 RepID=A0A1L9RBN1_ASPWE|nr:uncharacterized protein ASPWEDRAFT_53968 [Aspergillus wentii DTO 134E9]OJJ32332.1 hypothetical protein ASPWEDRAFT_53968 [Aspergillus wentii DTO 134E9]
MPRQALVLDGLWYCLCPSFSLTAINRPGVSFIRRKRSSVPPTSARWISASPQRCHNNNLTRAGNGGKTQNETAENLESETGEQASHQLNEDQHPRQDADTSRNTGSSTEGQFARHSPGVPKHIEKIPTASLEVRLQDLVAKTPKVMSATQILRTLIRDRHVRPEVRHYRALILANTDAERGSPEVVRELLAEMEANGIPADSGTLHSALQALAVHPDYLLRQEIVRTLRDRWVPLSPAGWHWVVAGLLREQQFELAIDHIAHMERQGIMAENWLHSLLIYSLCDVGEFDEVLRLIRSRTSQGHDMTLDLWSYVLKVASEAIHHETTIYAWRQMVELGYLRPSYAICSSVLTVASRTGDVGLAASVACFLTEHGDPLKLEDYEKMVDAHVTRGNLFSAFEVLCTMHESGIALEESSTRSILAFMLQEKKNPRNAWEMLKQLKTMKHNIPLGCAKVIIELCERNALYDPFAVDDGVRLYKELYALCPGGADVSVYNSLINMCRRAKDREAGMFIVKEMASLGVVPNARTFEHLTIMCLEAGNFRSAYLYFHDLLEREFTPGEDAQAEIRDLCSGSSDSYAIQLRYHSQIRGEAVRCVDESGSASGPMPLIKKIPSDAPEEYSNRDQNFKRRAPHRIVSKEERRAETKELRKKKRRREAIARAQEEEGWLEYEPGGLVPQDELSAKLKED